MVYNKSTKRQQLILFSFNLFIFAISMMSDKDGDDDYPSWASLPQPSFDHHW